jgi:DNA-binding transcriptional MocR family regulator
MSELLRYEKLAAELEGMMADGALRHGERLPSVRRLAQERRLSVSTVVQALRQLESAGLVEARPQSAISCVGQGRYGRSPVHGQRRKRRFRSMSVSAWCAFCRLAASRWWHRWRRPCRRRSYCRWRPCSACTPASPDGIRNCLKAAAM